MKPTILFVYPTMFIPHLGGVERVTDLLAKELIRRGYKVIYLNLTKSDIQYNFPAPVYFFPTSNYNDTLNFIFLKKFLKEENIDIVINQNAFFEDSYLYLSQSGTTNVKFISVFHATPTLNYNHFINEQLRLRNKTAIELLKLVYRFIVVWHRKKKLLNELKTIFNFITSKSDLVCLLSDTYRKDIKQLSKTIPNNLVNIPNPLTFNDVKTDNAKKENIILFVGRLEMIQKRPDRIIKIWNKIGKDYPDWKLYMVGDGPARKYLEKLAVGNKQIFFTGFQDPFHYYMRAKILCLTSNYEGWGMVLTECMTCGVVPIAFNSFAAITDIIANKKNGILVKPFKMKEYELQLRKLIEDEKTLNLYSKQGQQDVQQFNIDNIVDKWECLFSTI